MVSQKPKYCKRFERNSHWRKLSMIMVWERYCNASPKPEFFFIFFVDIFIHISANMSPFGLKFSQMILHTETSKVMYNWSFLFVVLHKPTLLPSTFKSQVKNRKGHIHVWVYERKRRLELCWLKIEIRLEKKKKLNSTVDKSRPIINA